MFWAQIHQSPLWFYKQQRCELRVVTVAEVEGVKHIHKVNHAHIPKIRYFYELLYVVKHESTLYPQYMIFYTF